MKSPDYVSRTGSPDEMKVVEDALAERGYSLQPDGSADNQPLGLKQYRRWQINGHNGEVVVLVWIEGLHIATDV